MIASSKESRRTLVERINEHPDLADGSAITLSILNDFSAPSKPGARFPIWFVAAFSDATGSEALRLHLMGPRLRKLVEAGVRLLLEEHGKRERQRLVDELIAEWSKRELEQLLVGLSGERRG